MLDIKPRDLEALEAIRTAMYACNAAETYYLQVQGVSGHGTFCRMHDALIDAAGQLFNGGVAYKLMQYIIDNGENVAYNLDLIRNEICPVCQQWQDNNHCTECGVCVAEHHNADCSELVCLGHETTDGPAGISAYCDGTCRTKLFSGYKY